MNKETSDKIDAIFKKASAFHRQMRERGIDLSDEDLTIPPRVLAELRKMLDDKFPARKQQQA